MLRKLSLIAAIVTLALGLTNAGMAAEFPARRITLIIPFNPGGQSDVAARLLIPGLEEALGVNVVPQYRVGAGGAVGWALLANSRPDGYTIAVTNLPHIIVQPLTIEGLGYDTSDLAPVYVYATTPGGIAVRKDSPFQTLEELVAYAQEHPGELTVAGTGFYTGNHLGYLQFQQLADVELTYINFTGAAPQTAAILGGQTDLAYGGTFIFATHRDQLRVLAFAAEERLEQFPDVPTFRELGYDLVQGIDRTITAPAGTPTERIEVLAEALRYAASLPEYKEKMLQQGFTLLNLGPVEYARFLQQKAEQYIQVLQEADIDE